MIKIGRPAAVLIGLIAAVVPATAVFAAPATASANKVYNSLAPPQGNIPSVGFEATSASSLGNEITLTRSAKVASVQVTMSSWGCQSRPSGNCVTTPGSTFSEPITLTIYQAPAVNPSAQTDAPGAGAPGAQILSVTKTFNIPYRPSQNDTKCTGAEAGEWFDKTNHECFSGFMTNITFKLPTPLVTLPQTLVFAIAYNTSDYGAAPYGDSTSCHASAQGCGYDSLNVGMSLDPDNLQKGSDPDPGTIWWSTTVPSFYCDGGTAGTGTFRNDSPGTPACWGDANPYMSAPWDIPAVQFIAA